MKEEWALVIYDEMHRLPANTFLELATLRTRYRLNLTATPFREDGRIDLVWALSGMPLGVDWTYFIEKGLIIQPEITVYVDVDLKAKTIRCDELLAAEGKTLIFCDSLKLGETLSSRYRIPFIHGSTPAKDRMKTIRASNQVIVSRVGDLGISIQDLERVIEFDFLFGSRSQELQRLGRLFHADYKGQHNILMTVDQYLKHRKRLYGVYEKGFKVKIVRGPGVPADLSTMDHRAPRRTRPLDLKPSGRSSTVQTSRSRKPKPTSDDTSEFPVFDERRKFDKDLILEILGSDYVVSRGGVELKTIRAILDFNHIKYGEWYTVRNLIRRLYDSFDIAGRTIGRTRVYFLSKQPGGNSE
jgi:superfamily II DNA or RNA helicase